LISIVLIPLLALVIRPIELGFDGFWAAISTPRVLASLRLSFGMALVAATIDSVFGSSLPGSWRATAFPARVFWMR